MNNPGVFQIFVYGSLRSGFKSPAYDYISRYFTLASEARVRGHLYDMGEFPAAVPTDDESFIIGELYNISNPMEFSWAIGQLDDYEGVTGGDDGENPLYQRAIADVYTSNGDSRAWIYWYTGDVSGKPQVSSGDILEYIRNKSNS
jgi:gamma-glutamylcyclotransferase (GGCT)/AIG2-like uncharacterized protein YtfP